jgi:hypothetical protein
VIEITASRILIQRRQDFSGRTNLWSEGADYGASLLPYRTSPNRPIFREVSLEAVTKILLPVAMRPSNPQVVLAGIDVGIVAEGYAVLPRIFRLIDACHSTDAAGLIKQLGADLCVSHQYPS